MRNGARWGNTLSRALCPILTCQPPSSGAHSGRRRPALSNDCSAEDSTGQFLRQRHEGSLEIILTVGLILGMMLPFFAEQVVEHGARAHLDKHEIVETP